MGRASVKVGVAREVEAGGIGRAGGGARPEPALPLVAHF